MYIFAKEIQAGRFIKVLNSKIFKDIQKLIKINQTNHICLNKNIGIDYRTNWKFVGIL